MKNRLQGTSERIGILPAWYTTGLVDAEGSFGVSINKAPSRSLGYVIALSFELALQASDKHILIKLKDYFGVGGIYRHGENMYRYKVSSIKDLLNVIIPHFEEYPLLTQKGADFHLFKLILGVMSKGPLSPKDLQTIVNIKAALNSGLSDTLKSAYPDTVPFLRQVIPFKGIPDPWWVCGFTEGEGCFYLNLRKNPSLKTKVEVRTAFILTQHSRDILLLEGLISFFGCGRCALRGQHLAGDFEVWVLTDLIQTIIPFFKKYPLLGVKSLDLKRLCLVADIKKDKGHLTEEGLKLIRDIKSRTVF